MSGPHDGKLWSKRRLIRQRIIGQAHLEWAVSALVTGDAALDVGETQAGGGPRQRSQCERSVGGFKDLSRGHKTAFRGLENLKLIKKRDRDDLPYQLRSTPVVSTGDCVPPVRERGDGISHSRSTVTSHRVPDHREAEGSGLGTGTLRGDSRR